MFRGEDNFGWYLKPLHSRTLPNLVWNAKKILTRNNTFHHYFAYTLVGHCRTSHWPDECGTFLRWWRLQKCLGRCQQSFRKGASGIGQKNVAPQKWNRTWGDNPRKLDDTVLGAPDMNAGFSESMSDSLDRRPPEPGHTQPDPCTDRHSRPKTVPPQRRSETVNTHVSVFVLRPTNRTSMAQDLFWGGSGCRAVAQTRQAFQKCLVTRRDCPKEGFLRRQVINLAPLRRVRAPLGSRMLVKANLDRLSTKLEHTWPDPCADQHDQRRCVPAQWHSETLHTHVSLVKPLSDTIYVLTNSSRLHNLVFVG